MTSFGVVSKLHSFEVICPRQLLVHLLLIISDSIIKPIEQLAVGNELGCVSYLGVEISHFPMVFEVIIMQTKN